MKGSAETIPSPIVESKHPSFSEEKREEAPPTSRTPPPREGGPPPFREATKGFSFSSLGKRLGFQPAQRMTPSTPSESTPVPVVRPTLVTPIDRIDREEGAPRYVAQAIKGSESARQQTAEAVYSQALRLAQTVMEKAQTSEEITGREIHQTIDDIIRELTYENSELLNFACSQVVEEGNSTFLSAKLVNKTILAVEIGIGKKMNKSKLFQLGMASFLSDLGISQVLDVINKNQVLTDEDWAKIREIPYKTVEILKRVPDLDQVILTVAQESHERADGSGPLGVKDLQQLDEFSRIVAVIDVFEALTHDRPHRERLLPHEAMKTILEEGSKFESEVLRLLIDRIGVYPVGSWVRLSNKEIAKVVGSNPGQPLRPRAKIIFNEHGETLEEPLLIDLAKNLSLQVLQPVSDEELKKFATKSS